MSLKFYFGPSGSGKSRRVYEDIIERSLKEPERNYLILVPDQFTMQTQKELCLLHPNKGIMNIDILSFSRLSYRIFEETKTVDRTLLDDTGKNLILRKVASEREDELLILGKYLKKIGYIHEVKSVISEFMQYDIDVDGVGELISFGQGKGELASKLKDVKVLYEGFLSYLSEKYITTEESLDLLCKVLPQSEIIKDSVVVFDGFTGFTPVQNRLLQSLMLSASEVIVTVTLQTGMNPYQLDGEHQLFYLSKKTVQSLERIAKEAGVKRGADVFLNDERLPRFYSSKELQHLEKNLFSTHPQIYNEKLQDIFISEAPGPKEEVQNICVQMKELLRTRDYCYRDIAVIAGDLEAYAHIIDQECKRYEIPVFMDRTRGVLQNPMVSAIVGALEVIMYHFSYDSVFHFLGTGMTEIESEEADALATYTKALGIRTRAKYESIFTRRSRMMTEENGLSRLTVLNETREKFITSITPLLKFESNNKEKEFPAKELIDAVYEFCVTLNLQAKMETMEAEFNRSGDLTRAKEYGQVYPAVMDLLHQMHELLQNETLSFKEFADILIAGFSELKVGIIPQSVDQVVIGDIERTRLKQVKALFFLGVNDGNIPKSKGRGGLISDIEREFLQESGKELAPTGRQQMFIQKLYLYLNLTKPSEKLYLSYSKADGQGKALRPAYLVYTMLTVFAAAKVTETAKQGLLQQIGSLSDSYDDFAILLGKYGNGMLNANSRERMEFFTLYGIYKEEKADEIKTIDRFIEAAFYEYQDMPLSKIAAQMIYGTMLENSVSRLEQFASCAYAHFLKYGLRLLEEEEFSFEAVDMGNVFHQVLQGFSTYLQEKGFSWFHVTKEQIQIFVKECLKRLAIEYGETVLYSSARNTYLLKRMERMMERTIETLQYQLKKGIFEPKAFEVPFSMIERYDGSAMKIRGRIDRLDTVEKDGNIYVKVIDYKSGNTKFDPVSLFYGLQLQLVVYMNAAIAMEKKEHPDKLVIPGAILYYHMNDPYARREEATMSTEQVEQEIHKQLRTDGLVNESEEVVSMLDHSFEESSLVIPVDRKKAGGYKATSSTGSEPEFQIISDYVNGKIRELAGEIVAGSIKVNPYEKGDRDSCTYCNYQSICGFDSKAAGFKKRCLGGMSKQEAMALITEKVKKE